HIYPAYASYKALKVSHNEALLTHWLTYWIVIGVFTGVEFVTDTFIFWLPFYNIFKMAFVVWLMLPQTQGSTYIYNTVIRPWLVQHEAEIDQYLHRAETKAKSKSAVWGQRGAETLQRVALNGIALVSCPNMMDTLGKGI
ncbi:TB2/DP1, HVA22 family-domain-containing protein, partial [Dimargaris cristalligena]